MPNRYDVCKLDKPFETDQGYMRADARLTRVGIFKYKNYDGTITKEFKAPEEVFNVDSMDSLAAIPLTNDHPPIMLDSSNTRYFQIGFTGEQVKKDGNFVKNRLTITDGETIRQVKDERKVEVSCGYHCDVIPEKGMWNGEVYDAVQKNIRYNHVSVVDKGRAGPEVKIKLNRMDAYMIECDGQANESDLKSFENRNDGGTINSRKQGGDIMPVKIKVDGIEYEVTEGLADKIVAKDKKIDSLTTDIEKRTKELDEAKGKVDALEGEVAKKDEEIKAAKADKPSMAEIRKEAKSRVDLEGFTKEIMTEKELEAINFDEITDVELKKLCIKKADEKADLEDVSDDYVNGMFSVLKKGHSNPNGKDKADSLKNGLGKHANDKGPADISQKRKDKMERDSERWKKPFEKTAE
jgi:hypothetical protein